MARLSSLDQNYTTGALSNFPTSLDTKDSLYEVKNNAETKLRTSLSYNGKLIIVENAASFPQKGLLRIGPPPGKSGAAELIYYNSRTNDTFKELTRGFAGSRQNQWPSGSWATNAVTAEPHNAVKDAIINIEEKLGTKTAPADGSLNNRLNYLEARFLAPKASFRAFPKKGIQGLKVRFQNFSEGDIVRYLWDFGDGTQSTLKHPQHTYLQEGFYTVKLSVITSTGGQGSATKDNYIEISNQEKESFFYCSPQTGVSRSTALKTSQSPTTFKFVDQTDGEVKQRFWIFGDGTENLIIENPNVHDAEHIYEEPGIYDPSLLVAFADENLKRIFLTQKVVVE
jgi:PKD repeat protein